jgi:predicted ATP-dependent protease
VRQGHFNIWAVGNIDEAMELLTGMPAGEPDAKGELPPDSINFQIALQLAELAQMRQDYARPKQGTRHRKKR